MTRLQVEHPEQAGWSTVSTAGLHVVVRAGGAVVDRVRSAAAGGNLDEVLDALTAQGVGSTPEFVAVAETEPVRVVTRGRAYAVVTGPDGPLELRAPARGPWGDTDAPAGTTAVALLTGEQEAAGVQGPEATRAQQAEPQPRPAGWRRPQLFQRDHVAAAPSGAPTPPQDAGDEVDELPSYDHLFGATQHDRPAYIEQHDTGTISEPPIGHAPIESAGGFDPGSSRAGSEHTLAPPPHTLHPAPQPGRDDEGNPRPGIPPAAPAPSPAGPPSPAAPPSPPARGRIIDSVPWRSGGSNVPAPDAGPVPAVPPAPPAAVPQPPPAAVPPPPRAPAVPPPVAAEPEPGPAAPAPSAVPTPAAAPHAGDEADATVDRSALLTGGPSTQSGPTVLAVLCPAGHTSPPHSGSCRQCGREIPPQQPFQTSRPPLGVLRLPTGDVVTLDRGVLLGRSPKVNAELSAADRPHLVRVPSPENDISRNHVEILLEGWHVLIRDLGSTNGTTVTLPGQPPVRLRPGDQQVLEPGTVVTLADEVPITYEVPA
jgi:hypothetical protein